MFLHLLHLAESPHFVRKIVARCLRFCTLKMFCYSPFFKTLLHCYWVTSAFSHKTKRMNDEFNDLDDSADRNPVSCVQARAVTSLASRESDTEGSQSHVNASCTSWAGQLTSYMNSFAQLAAPRSGTSATGYSLHPSVGQPSVASLLWDASHATNTKPCTIWVND